MRKHIKQLTGFIQFPVYVSHRVARCLVFLVVCHLGSMLNSTYGLAANAEMYFTEVAAESGIHFRHWDGRSGRRYFVETLGSGAAWFDYDRDGDIDLYLANGADLPGKESRISPTNVLYRNNGYGTFSDITVEANVGDASYSFGCCVGDFDNDGYPDLYVTNLGTNILYRNNGNSTFSDVTAKAGVAGDRWSASAAFADYDKDGDLDLYVVNYVAFHFESHNDCLRSDLHIYCPPGDFEGVPDILYQNNGDGTFTDVTHEAGVFQPEGKGLGVVWGDYNNDTYPDVFVANDTTPDMLYRNNRDGTFTDVALFVGVALGEEGMPLGGMGANFGDYDNDGWLDLVVTNFEDDPNNLFRNDRDGTFVTATYSGGFGMLSFPYVGWGVDLVDLDNDGYQDILVVNGHIYDNIELINKDINKRSTYAQRNNLFRNLANASFVEITERCGPGLRPIKVSRGAAFGDYDNDGDLDILITNSNQTPDLLRNQSENSNHWLVLETIGVSSNRDGIGTRVTVKAGGISQIREVKSGSSYLCQSDIRLHFGLGEATEAVVVEVRWPSGVVDRFNGVNANKFLQVTEGEGKLVVLDSKKE